VFDWIKFLDLAEDLATRADDEAASRSAISRAYYAAFHIGRDHLARSGIPPDRGRNAHHQVQAALRAVNQGIAEDLALLHFWRKQADYDDLSLLDVEEQARIAVVLARSTIDTIRALT
jgi:muconolactone delta-isomerase